MPNKSCFKIIYLCKRVLRNWNDRIFPMNSYTLETKRNENTNNDFITATHTQTFLFLVNNCFLNSHHFHASPFIKSFSSCTPVALDMATTHTKLHINMYNNKHVQYNRTDSVRNFDLRSVRFVQFAIQNSDKT